MLVGLLLSFFPPETATQVADPALDEISGLVVSDALGVLWVLEDSGGRPALYALDPTTGQTVGTLRVEGARNVDWEDLTRGPCHDAEGMCLWIGEFGDNARARRDTAILRVREPAAIAPDMSAPHERYAFSWPSGPENAEGLVIGDQGLPWVVSKRVGAAVVAALPRLDPAAAVTLTPRFEVDIGPRRQVTGAARGADGGLFLRTYDTLLFVDPAASGVAKARPVALPAPLEGQGETVAVDPRDGALWFISEGVRPAVWRMPRAR